MAHSPIRINTNLHGTKRGLSREGNGGGADFLTVPGQEHALDNLATVELPPFLNISFTGQFDSLCRYHVQPPNTLFH